jgi:hypothetical protein
MVPDASIDEEVCDEDVPTVVVPAPVEPFIPVALLPAPDPELRDELQDKASAKGNTKNIFFIRTYFS